MKKLVFSLLACLALTLQLPSQTPSDYQFQFQFDNTLQKWVPGPDGAWFGAGWSTSHPGYPMGVPFIIKWNPATDSLYWKREVPMPFAEVVFAVDVLPTPDGGAYLGAAFDGCDYPTPDGLAKLDASGTVLWLVETPDQYRLGSKIWLIPYPGGHVLFQTSDYQIEYDADGGLKWARAFDFPWNGLAPRLNGGYLVYGDYKLGTTNLLLSILETPFPEYVVDAHQLPSGNWLVLGSEYLFRLAPDLSVQEQVAAPWVDYGARLFETDGNYWVSSGNASDGFALRRIDTMSLSVLSTYDLGYNHSVYAIIYEPGDSLLWLSGDCNFDLNRRGFLIAAPKDNPEIVIPDRSLAVTDIRLEQIPVISYDSQCFSFDGKNHKLDIGPVYVTVTNTGSLPVQKFSVNGFYNRCSFICQSYTEIVENRNAALQPGESLEILLLPNFKLTGQINSNIINLCFWAAAPDDQLDILPDDDAFCKQFAVMVPDYEPELSPANIQVFPNPATDRLVFTLDIPQTAVADFNLALSDLSGKVLLRQEFTGSSFELQRGTLPAGFYFYEISNARLGSAQGRIVFVGDK